MRRSWTDNDLKLAVRDNKSYAGVLRTLGFNVSGGMHTLIKGHVLRLNLDVSHFTGQGHRKDSTHNWTKKVPIERILIKNSNYRSTALRRRLFKEGILENVCAECGQKPNWNNKPLTLQLDHINGDHYDNRLENLRLLCPNCHSQTNTFCGKNRRKKPQRCLPKKLKSQVPEHLCANCGTPISCRGIRCKSCSVRHRAIFKINWPPIEELTKMVSSSNLEAVGRLLGVSGKAVRNHIKTWCSERELNPH